MNETRGNGFRQRTFRPTKRPETIMKKLAYATVLGASLLALPALAAEQPAVDPDLAQFRAAYTSGDGLA
jgi:hypothetical protein